MRKYIAVLTVNVSETNAARERKAHLRTIKCEKKMDGQLTVHLPSQIPVLN